MGKYSIHTYSSAKVQRFSDFYYFCKEKWIKRHQSDKSCMLNYATTPRFTACSVEFKNELNTRFILNV